MSTILLTPQAPRANLVVAMKKYRILPPNAKPDARKGDQYRTAQYRRWAKTTLAGEATVACLQGCVLAPKGLEYRRPVKVTATKKGGAK